MSRFSVEWQADVKEAGADAAGRLARVIEELGAYQKVAASRCKSNGEGRVSFRFTVEGFNSPMFARAWAERALRMSLFHARVGAPDLPLGEPAVRLVLDDRPIVRPMAD